MMRKLALASLTDRGCWISDDRVYAFVTAGGGIGQIGFHGLQPVSRNSRFFRREEGAILLQYRIGAEDWRPMDFSEVEWFPAGIRAEHSAGEGKITCEMLAEGSGILIFFRSLEGPGVGVRAVLHLDGLERDVQGVREWREPRVTDAGMVIACRDRVILKDWICRTGPYAGDFLIPESWRRKIYLRRCRSGLATFEDVRPEYRDADIPLYDAATRFSMEGEGWNARREGEVIEFIGEIARGNGERTCIEIRFEAIALAASGTERRKRRSHLLSVKSASRRATGLRKRYDEILSRSPALILPEYPEIERFFAGVPSLVESCRVRELGMTRANPGAYYWIWAWDSLVTALECRRWGDLDGISRTLRFIDEHRDDDGLIPGRWTRDLQPLDTPPRGFVEALFCLLACEHYFQAGSPSELHAAWPSLTGHLNALDEASDASGLLPGIGAYPDLPLRFGRTERSGVAMEIGANYLCARLMTAAAAAVGDESARLTSLRLAERIARSFGALFMDPRKGFLRDAIDCDSRKPNESYPLFSLLFLQSPLGWRLIEREAEAMARFVSRELVSEQGVSLLPSWDKNRKAESVTDAWYPHWDIYALKLLRRAGDAEGIMRWLKGMESALQHLGYCPEFLSLEGFRNRDPDPYRFHGAASNLNCATGWYRALLEAVVGLEFDPGGITLVPLSLPLPHIALERLIERGTEWSVDVRNEGPRLNRVSIDGEELRGCLKIPSRYMDRGRHRLEIRYGDEDEHMLLFTSLVNSEVRTLESSRDSVTVTVNLLGAADIAFAAPVPPRLLFDGNAVDFSWEEQPGRGRWSTDETGLHAMTLKSEQ